MLKALIVDDHPVVRLAVGMLLEAEKVQIVGETGSGREALQMVRDLRPDLLIIDLGLSDMGGLEVIKRLNDQTYKPKILVLTSQSTGVYAERCRRAGASGFMYKADDLRGLNRGIDAVMNGYSYFPDVTSNSVRESDNVDEAELLRRLTTRELAVLQRLAQGQRNREIANAMSLSDKTVSTYKSRILERLNAGSVVELAEIAKRNQLA